MRKRAAKKIFTELNRDERLTHEEWERKWAHGGSRRHARIRASARLPGHPQARPVGIMAERRLLARTAAQLRALPTTSITPRAAQRLGVPESACYFYAPCYDVRKDVILDALIDLYSHTGRYLGGLERDSLTSAYQMVDRQRCR